MEGTRLFAVVLYKHFVSEKYFVYLPIRGTEPKKKLLQFLAAASFVSGNAVN